MDPPQSTETALRLQAILVSADRMPRGCRILSFDDIGMLLEWHTDEEASEYAEGEAVTVMTTVHKTSGSGHTNIAIPSVVRHENHNRISIEFAQPEPELADLLASQHPWVHETLMAPHLNLDTDGQNADEVEAAFPTSGPPKPGASTESSPAEEPLLEEPPYDAPGADSPPPTASDLGEERQLPDEALQTLPIRATNKEPESSSPGGATDTTDDLWLEEPDTPQREGAEDRQIAQPGASQAQPASTNLLFIGLPALLVGVGLLIAILIYLSGIGSRLDALEQATADLSREQTQLRNDPTTDDELEQTVAAISARLDGVVNRLDELARKPPSQGPASPTAPDVANAPENTTTATPALPQPETRVPKEQTAPAESEEAPAPAVKPTVPAAPVESSSDDVETESKPLASVPLPGEEGPWSVNLISLKNKEVCDRLAARARSLDIPVEQSEIERDGETFWRLRVTGFASAADARAYAETAKTKLGLKEVWITSN